MSEGKKARIRVVSRLVEPDGDAHEIKNARSGLLRPAPDGWVLEYDDVQDEEKAHIVLTMQPERGHVRMQRMGMVSSVLDFVPGEKIASRSARIAPSSPYTAPWAVSRSVSLHSSMYSFTAGTLPSRIMSNRLRQTSGANRRAVSRASTAASLPREPVRSLSRMACQP